jgi:hypothetical protein
LDTAEDTGRPGSKKKEGWWISMHSGEEDTGGGDQPADSGKEETSPAGYGGRKEVFELGVEELRALSGSSRCGRDW